MPTNPKTQATQCKGCKCSLMSMPHNVTYNGMEFCDSECADRWASAHPFEALTEEDMRAMGRAYRRASRKGKVTFHG